MTSKDYKCTWKGCTKVDAGDGDFPDDFCGGIEKKDDPGYGVACPIKCCFGANASPDDRFTCRHVDKQVQCPLGPKSFAVKDGECVDCYRWCDQSDWTCKKPKDQADWDAHVGVAKCSECYPDGQFWCADGSGKPVKITSKSQWDALDKTKGKLSSTGDCPKSSLWMWIWLVLIIATVAALVVLSIIFMKGKKKAPSKYRYR